MPIVMFVFFILTAKCRFGLVVCVSDVSIVFTSIIPVYDHHCIPFTLTYRHIIEWNICCSQYIGESIIKLKSQVNRLATIKYVCKTLQKFINSHKFIHSHREVSN